MAPQVLIDFDSVGERIVTAIKSSFDGISKTIVAQTSKQEKQEERALGVREQILTNAQVLWPIIDVTRRNCNNEPYNEPRTTPEMFVIVMGEGTTMSACVVRNGYDFREQPIDDARRRIFLRSIDTTSADKALEKLLEMTMVMLNKSWKGSLLTTGEQKVMSNHGHYYAPGKATL
ncbi:hypothetical protein LTR97_004046 [Elasticomyces elasticus]|uniref:Uncharacterized protein n=1 Tax=Elasticomyces elasticus TaxID=574655 RepID=A0AAN7ZPH7_9PEZI|nr:hypothetical protein LTR97_004046 [Elasticomyces elasticus]